MNGYFKVISLVERLHRQFLELVKLELDGLGIHDINNVQGMMLFSIGDAEMTVGELTLRGCYLGSNVSYNVKKMVENGYLVQERRCTTAAPSTFILPKRGASCATPLRRCISVISTYCRRLNSLRTIFSLSASRCVGSSSSGSALPAPKPNLCCSGSSPR